ncbi:LolA family protein [Bathymodiolus septemdierum thioautotrophic gill symbiont]|uniref:Outer membrane lipoprotein carrier protein n=1 Tax=endosymbiont of Bathymodiolus septemdierum str. Myojin knoll TaxID=1303921 RepID=A0A0P0UPU5_9GAMM|nr:outer-membrane lipoprotein carrier protein LolA [Bathymodiolus septemdierum thioautotrophic gill symbiont]BAS67078.1 outer membrane lipoprotein carrier protein [endosymbiont of Bathymodiolus septemdierum str. Myojin knoll]
MIKILIVISALWGNIALSEGAAAKTQFSDYFNNLNSLKADFTQSVYTAGDIFISETAGNFSFQRPQQLRWHTIKPSEQTLLLNNNELWMIDTELEQTVLQKNQDFSKTPLYWLINKPNTLKNTPKYSHSEGGIDWYLTNQKTQPLGFGFVGKELSTISLENELDQTIYITFSNIKVNAKINPQDFALNIPSDFDVIR